ncbi:protein PTHB1 [Topomyia yanbarensis]|uniref:protein PTHB1 n=1 Tax=Topomyia yanbarensis TaxID=2498891 RepID=UPI00273AFB2F|nr:protein PTHB1 [Topomyia yanbarensis]
MSLFKVCNWWKTQCPDVEPNYDSFSIHCCRLRIQDGEKDNIIIGSHSGHLSIYQPSYKTLAEGELDDDRQFENIFQHSDVILETKLALPVIGIRDGKFTTATKADTKLQLAILHPMKICIYQIITVGGIADHGDHTKLQLLYEHNLSHPAFSFCRGNFGGIKGRDFMCIQHTNGSLRFFEQDGITFECNLPGERHIPSPIHYVARIDCFVTVSPSWELECYRYQDLSEPNETLRKHEPIWSMCVGEYALDLNVHQISNLESVVIIMGENNLVCVTDTGKVRFIKKLDYSPICFHSFVIGWYWEPDARLMIAVVSESGSLLLYEENQIVWSAELPDIPVALSRANVSSLPGALVALGSTGQLNVGYLGSEPHLFKVPPLNLAPFDVTKCQKEMMELEKEIRSGVDFSDITVINAATERELTMHAIIDSKLEKCTQQTHIPHSENPIYMCQLIVTAKPHINVELMQICITTDSALKCSKKTFMFRDVQTETIQTLDTLIYPYEPAVPVCTSAQVSCSYTNKQGITRILQKSIRLPLEMFVRTTPASKEALHKITLALHGRNENLGNLFPEFISEGSPHVLGLLSLVTGSKVTIVAAKNTNRFRVQSEDLLAIPLIISELVERISLRNGANNPDDKNRVLISSNPPMEGLLEEIDRHYQLRQKYKELEKDLEIRTDQMRLFERRFVVKLQERSLRALDGILMLLKQNHADISKTCSALKITQSIRFSQIHLSALLRLIETGFVYSDISSKYLDTIKSICAAPVFDSSELDWEEMMQTVIKFLSHNGPFRSDTGISSFDEKFVFAVDENFKLGQFKKQFSTLIARIGEKRSKTGRSSADFEEELEEQATENEVGSSEWVSYEKANEFPF